MPNISSQQQAITLRLMEGSGDNLTHGHEARVKGYRQLRDSISCHDLLDVDACLLEKQ